MPTVIFRQPVGAPGITAARPLLSQLDRRALGPRLQQCFRELNRQPRLAFDDLAHPAQGFVGLALAGQQEGLLFRRPHLSDERGGVFCAPAPLLPLRQ